MSTLPAAIDQTRSRTLVNAHLFLATAAIITTGFNWREEITHPFQIAITAGIVTINALTIATHARFPRATFFGSTILLQALIILAPWFVGGVRRPLSYLEIPLLLFSSFLVGHRLTWALAISFCLNTIAAAWFETNGLVASNSPLPLIHILLLAEGTAFGLYFVAKPIDLTQRLLAQARASIAQRLEHQHSLSRLNEILDERIVEREKELLSLRRRLTQGSEVLSSSYEPILRRISVRAHYIEEVLKSHGPTIQFPVSRILAGCERLTRMHQAIARFSRLDPQAIQVQDFDAESIQTMVRQLWDDIRTGYPRANHRLFLNQLSGCRAEPEMFRQVWQHLLSNAAKFSARQAKPRIVVGWKDGEFFINDNGVGFDAANARNLFEIFGRQHESNDFPGDGIGLASVKRIIELHQGSIRIESEPGKGASCYFRLAPVQP